MTLKSGMNRLYRLIKSGSTACFFLWPTIQYIYSPQNTTAIYIGDYEDACTCILRCYIGYKFFVHHIIISLTSTVML